MFPGIWEAVLNKAVFLDRDGVLVRPVVHNGYAYGPLTLEDFQILPGVSGPVRRIHEAGFLTVLATNQPGIARGLLDWKTLEKMHERLRAVLPLDAVFVCPHTDRDGCACRKPKPGMLKDAAEQLSIDLTASYFVGDTGRDVQAALAAGVTPILLDTAYNRDLGAAHRVADLEAAAGLILRG